MGVPQVKVESHGSASAPIPQLPNAEVPEKNLDKVSCCLRIGIRVYMSCVHLKACLLTPPGARRPCGACGPSPSFSWMERSALADAAWCAALAWKAERGADRLPGVLPGPSPRSPDTTCPGHGSVPSCSPWDVVVTKFPLTRQPRGRPCPRIKTYFWWEPNLASRISTISIRSES